MARKHKPEDIIGKLREAEIVLAQGGTVADACRRIGVTEQSYYRWRKEYGGLKMDQARRMKELEKENARLRRAVSDLTLDKLILQEAANPTFRINCHLGVGARSNTAVGQCCRKRQGSRSIECRAGAGHIAGQRNCAAGRPPGRSGRIAGAGAGRSADRSAGRYVAAVR